MPKLNVYSQQSGITAWRLGSEIGECSCSYMTQASDDANNAGNLSAKSINNINLYYEEYGQGEPLVLIAGFTADHLIWMSNVRALAEHYRVIILDNRGVGQSDSPDYPYTMEMFAEDIVALCKQLGINVAHVVGNSMGGMIAQVLAYKYPEFVKTLVISNSMLKIDIKFALVAEGLLELLKQNISKEIITKLLLGWVYSSNYLNLPDKIQQMITYNMNAPFPVTVSGYKNQLLAIQAFDSSSWIAKIAKPCLVIGSDEDIIWHAKEAHFLASQIPNAQFYLFSGGVGHLPFIEKPEEFNRVVLSFLQQQAGN